MKKGYIIWVIILFLILGFGYLYYYNTGLKWIDVDKVSFKEDEYSKLSLVVIGDNNLYYDFYESNNQSGIRKKSDTDSYVTIGRPYWLSTIINDTRKEYPISKYRNTPGILIKDSYTNEVYFVKWERELASDLCEIIKDDDMAKTCSKYKDYNYKIDDFIEYKEKRKELSIERELIINDVSYSFQEDGLIYKTSGTNRVVLKQVVSDELKGLLDKIVEEYPEVEEQKELVLKHNNKNYNLLLEDKYTKELLEYFAKMGEINLSDYYSEDIIETVYTYTDLNYKLENDCMDIKDYNFTDNIEINVYDIYIDNTPINFKYQINGSESFTKIFVNNKEISSNNSVVPILTGVCKYDNYFMYVQGWEGSPTYTLVNKNGIIVHHFIGRNVNYHEGVLEVEEINKNDIMNQNDNKIEKYQIDLTKDMITKDNVVVEDFPCEVDGPGYDC